MTVARILRAANNLRKGKYHSVPTMIDLIERATCEPEFLEQLRQDPFGTARAEGYEFTDQQVADMLGVQGSNEQELAEALQARLSFTDASGSQRFGNWLVGSDGGLPPTA